MNMDMIKQFPDISMEVREKYRLRKKLQPKHMYESDLVYDTVKYLTNSPNHGIKNWGVKLVLLVLVSATIIYFIIL